MRPILHAPGIYFGMDAEEYHADPSLGSSDIRSLLKGTRKYWLRSTRNPTRSRYVEADTDGTVMGTAVHTSLLDGPVAFAAKYMKRPDDPPNATSAQKSAVTRKANEEAKAAGKISLHPDEWGLIEDLAWLVPSHPQLSDVLTGGEHEVSIFWEDRRTGVACKCRPDILKPRGIGDIKTIANEYDERLEKACKRAIKNYRYDIQAEHYLEGRGMLPLLLKAGQVFDCRSSVPGSERLELLDFVKKCANEREFFFQLVFVSKALPETWAGYWSRNNPIMQTAREHIDGALDAYVKNADTAEGKEWPETWRMSEITYDDMPGGEFGWS
jgi:hypothetical protein